MGIKLFGGNSSSAFDSNKKSSTQKGNPDPSNYKIIQHVQHENNLVVMIQYPDCTNYEGKKILVFKNITIKDLLKQKLIDPHFSENKEFHSPIARFAPTDEGWSLAQHFSRLSVVN